MNRDEDLAIIHARQAMREAQKTVEEHGTPLTALDLQRKKQHWEHLSRLTLVHNEEHS
jgi:mRNA-degrading endonuclease HigB of HigAB toxin-antitoxin module